ncbi:MAG: SwmB domain-containing protein [bacterium]|nr:SwmB domain-containing protein [bacterium]
MRLTILTRLPRRWPLPASAVLIAIIALGALLLAGLQPAYAQDSDTRAPLFSIGWVNGDRLTLEFNEDLDTGSAPKGSAFAVRATRYGTTRTLNGTGTAAISTAPFSQFMRVTLNGSVRHDETLTVNYTAPSQNGLQDAAGNRVPSFTGQRVSNNTPRPSDTTPPAFSSAEVSKTTLRVTFNEELFRKLGTAGSAFEVSATRNGTARTIAGTELIKTGTVVVTSSGRGYLAPTAVAEVTLASAVFRGETVSVSYTKPSQSPLKDEAGNEVQSFAGRSATNNTPLPTATGTGPGQARDASGINRLLANQVAITFDQGLDATSRPAASAFIVTSTIFDRTGTHTVTGSATITAGVVPRAIPGHEPIGPGSTVTLQLDRGIHAPACFTVKYIKPTQNPLKDPAGNEVESFTYYNGSRCGVPFLPLATIQSAEVDGQTLTMTFSDSVRSDSTPDPSAFTVTVGSSRRNVASGGVAIAGSKVTLTLTSPVVPSDGVKVRYTEPAENPLRDANGTEVETFEYSHRATNRTAGTLWTATLNTDRSASGCRSGMPAAQECSSALSDDSFKVGALSYQVAVLDSEFRSDRFVLGLSRDIPASWTLHVGDRSFAVSSASPYSSGSRSHVVWDDVSRTFLGYNQTVSVRLTRPAAPTQTVQALSDTPSDSSLAIQDEVTVVPDSSVTTGTSTQAAPSLTGVAVSSSPASGDTYRLGETISVTLTFSEAVDVVGTPRLKIDMDPAAWGEKLASYASGSGTASLTFTHTVVEPNYSTQGIAVLADSLALNGGTISDVSSQTDADLSHTGLAHDADHKVNWQLSTNSGGEEGGASGGSGPEEQQVAPASVSGVSVSSSPQADATYRNGETIQVSVTFGVPVDVDTSAGTPRLKIDMDPAEWGEKWASYASGTGTATLTFTHTVVEPNISTKGIAVLADTLELNGGTIRSGGENADLAHDGLSHDSGHKVDWQQSASTASTPPPPPAANPPGVAAVVITSDPGDDDTYALGNVIRISVTFDEAVDVTGAPRIAIDMDPAEWGKKLAAYHSGSGTKTLVFTHTVVEPNFSTQGIAVLANSLELNGGTIRSGGADAGLSHDGLAHDADHKVDWRLSDGGGPGS